MYITEEKFNLLKNLCEKVDEEEKTIQIQGVFSCAVECQRSLTKGAGLEVGKKVLFKVKTNTIYDIGDKWEENREFRNQSPMLLTNELQKNNINMIMFFEPEMTVN